MLSYTGSVRRSLPGTQTRVYLRICSFARYYSKIIHGIWDYNIRKYTRDSRTQNRFDWEWHHDGGAAAQKKSHVRIHGYVVRYMCIL